jgi:hypothetical protein
VDLDPPQRSELVVEDATDERVAEGVAPGRPAARLDHASRRCVLEHPHERVERPLDRRLERGDVELAADRRRDRQHLAALRLERTQPAADDVAHAARHREWRIGARWIDGAFVQGEEAHELPDEERVPFRLAVDRGYERVRHRAAGGELEEARDLRLAQPAELDPLADSELREILQRVVARELRLAVRPDDEDVGIMERARQEAEQPKRRRIRPVEVVEDD